MSYGPSEQKAYNYDKAGNLIEKGNSYTLSGNYTQILPTGNGVEYWKYGYDAQNQLTTVWKNGTDNASIIARFAYDYAGKRLKAVEGNSITHYVYGYGGQLLYEVQYSTTASDPSKATGTQLQPGKATSYIYAMGHQLAKVEGSITGGNKYYYHNDNLGSTMLMTKYVDVSKVQSGDLNKPNPIVFLQDYTPFGQNLHQPGEPAATNETEATLKFTGQIEDADIGLCYYNARYYDPEVGRFTQEDSYEGSILNSQSQNLYIYVLNNPLNYVDPTGHRDEPGCTNLDDSGKNRLKDHQIDNNSNWQIESSGIYKTQFNTQITSITYVNSLGEQLHSVSVKNDSETVVINDYCFGDGKVDHREIKKYDKNGRLISCTVMSNIHPKVESEILTKHWPEKSGIYLSRDLPKSFPYKKSLFTPYITPDDYDKVSNVLLVLSFVAEQPEIGIGMKYLSAFKIFEEVEMGGAAERGANTVFSNGAVTIEGIKANTKMFSGKSVDEIAEILTKEGYDVTVESSKRSSSGAKIIKINNHGNGKNITQIQVSPGGGRHGANPYVKISTSDQGIIKIVDGPASLYKTDGKETATIIFTGGN